MKTLILAAASSAILLTLTTSPVWAQENIRELQQRFEAVRKVVDDPLTDEAGIRKSLRELEKLAQLSNDAIEDESDASKPALALAGSVADTLHHVKSRLPADLRQGRREIRPGFPVPKFEDRTLLAGEASKLDGAQKNLARQLRKTNELDDQGEKLLFEVSKAQENLAWEAGWPFTKEEANQVREAGRLTEEVYASRLNRGTERVNKQIGSEIDENGRERQRVFVLHRSAMLAQHLEKVRGIGSLPEALFREFDQKEVDALLGGADAKNR